MKAEIDFSKLTRRQANALILKLASVRRGNGMTKEKFRKDPKFVNVRNNAAEFGGLAIATKSFRQAISMGRNFADKTLGSRLTKTFRVIMKKSNEPRGQRSVVLSQNRSMLQGLELNACTDLFAVFSAPFSVEVQARHHVITSVTNVNDYMIEKPGNATHFRLTQILGTVADTVYNAAEKKFEPAHDLNGRCEITYSDYHSVRITQPLNISLETAISSGIPDNVSVVHCIGIEFYEKVGGEFYSIFKNLAMKIISVV